MALTHIVDLESGIAVLGQINDCFDQVNTNTTNINTNTSNIATNTSDIATKQTKSTISTLRFDYDTTQTGNYTLLGTDNNKMFDITNIGDSLFTLPPTGTISAFVVGDMVIVINNQSSVGNVTLTAGAGVTIQTGLLSAVIAAGETATVIRSGTNRYKRIY